MGQEYYCDDINWLRRVLDRLMFLKRMLDKILAIYLDKPSCAMSGSTFDRHGRRSNSLYDHYRNRSVKKELDKIIKV